MSAVQVVPGTDRSAWDAFVQANTDPPEFLASWTWGTFQAAAGRAIERLTAQRDGRLVGAATLVEHTTRLGRSFLLAPRSPVIAQALSSDDQAAIWRGLTEAIDRRRNARVMFLKVEPNVRPSDDLGFEPGTGIHPVETLLLDLGQSDEGLLGGMHPKTRYNIRLAERHGVRVRFERSPSAVAAFLQLLEPTAVRQHIGVFPAAYYRTMAETFGQDFDVALAERDGQPLAAALLIRYGSTYTYVHGASSDGDRAAMAPHLMQWECARRGRSLGCTVYDLYGIAPTGAVDHPWAGITRFKRGFGGRVKVYPGAFNRIYQRSWYLAYRLAKRMMGR